MTFLDSRLTDSDPWAAALLAFYFVREGEPDRAVERLSVLSQGSGFHDQVLHLWASSELAAVPGPGAELLATNRQRHEAALARIEREFEAMAPNWIDAGVPGTYLTRVALAFGAVSSYRNATNSSQAAGLLPRIKQVFFRDFLAGGRLKSRRGGESLYSDVVLASVPFGLMDAGNQIMVESVAALEARQYHGGFAFSADSAHFGGAPKADLDALMAWYFSERGEGAKAQLLLEPWTRQLGTRADGLLPWAEGSLALDREHWERTKPAQPTSARATVLYHLAVQNLRRLQGSGTAAGTTIVHEPEGHGSRYHPQDRNREPLHATAGERVVVRAVVRPLGDETQVMLRVEGAEGSGPLNHVGSDGAEGHFEGALTGLVAGRPVRYRFEAQSKLGAAESAWFTFAPGRREAVVAVSPQSGGMVTLTTESGATLEAVFDVSRDSGADLRWTDDAAFALVAADQPLVRSWSGFGLSALSVDLDGEGRPLRLVVRLAVGDEEFYGAGERFSSLGYRGKRLDCWVFNQYRDQGLKTYIPLPFWQSSAGWGLRVLGDGYSATGFCDRLDGLVEVEVDWDEVAGLRFYAGRPWDMVRAYQAESGPVALPPRWSFGPWMSSNNWDNQRLTLEQAELTRTLSLPATVLVLEQWSDEATFYVFNDAVYARLPGDKAFTLSDFQFPAEGRWPDPKAMVQQLHDQGLKVLLWQAPVMKYMDGLPHAQRDADEATMIERNWALRRADGQPYRIPDFEWFKRSLVPDFSHAEASRWWLEKRRYLFDEVGIDGIKTDGGEGVYGDAVDSKGHRGDALRNRYPVDYIGAFHQYILERKGGDGLTFSRAGFDGAWTMPSHWAGDERSTFEAFRNSVRAGLTAGVSGLPFWGWDLGGFNGDIPDAELYLRGVAMAAFCPLMQYHAESKGEKNRDRTPWNIAERTGDPRVIPVYRKFAQARMNLLPYLWDEAQHSAATGEALMRALWAEYPDVAAYRRIDDQYFLGRHLLVAPVVHQGAVGRSVVFPPGVWVPLFGGEPVEGPIVQHVDAPLDTLPVWFRAGAALALNLPASGDFPGDVGSQWDQYTRLTFRLAPGVPVDTEYRTYDGAVVTLQGLPEDQTVPVL